MVNVTVEYPDMRQTVQVPLSVANQIASRERILTSSYRAAICHKAITARTYRAGYDDLNYSLYKDNKKAVPFSTYVTDIVDEGTALIAAKRKQTEIILEEFGFDGTTGQFKQKELPDYLRNRRPETVKIDPKDILKTESSSELYDPEIEDPNIEETEQYSEPDTEEVNLPAKPRSRNRTILAPESIRDRCENYVRWREALSIDNACKVRRIVELETEPEQVVYLMIDAVYVPGQSKVHVKGGKTVSDNADRVEHWNCRIEWNETDSYAITDGDLNHTMKQALAFLLKNGLITRYFVFIVDGEEKIFTAINTYFSEWEYEVYLDYSHAAKKCYDLLSNAIISKRVPDPRGEKEYYLRGPKKGEIKKQEMTSLSVLYTRKVVSMLWVGNIEEVRKYLKNIDPKVITNPEYIQKLLSYFDDSRKGKYIPCYALRKVSGLRNSSNGVEGLNNQSVACNQKQSNKSFRAEGSHALATLKVLNVNREWETWFVKDVITFDYISEKVISEPGKVPENL